MYIFSIQQFYVTVTLAVKERNKGSTGFILKAPFQKEGDWATFKKTIPET